MDNRQEDHQKFGSYITLKNIGGSDHSTVYAAMHEPTGQKVALRVLTITAKDVNDALIECLDILYDLSTLQIPNAVQIHDFGNDGETLYIAMSVLNGGTLFDRIRVRMLRTTPPTLPSIEDVLTLVDRMSLALDTLHQMGMIHGQIQPHSIMFDDRGDSLLADIGLTRILKVIYNLDATNSFNMTQYSPPELWVGVRPSPATDQYAFACLIYQLLTGVLPFKGTSIFALMQAHTNDVAAPPHYIRDSLPDDLAMVFWRALAKPIDKRYPNMRSFYQDLQRCLSDYPIQETDFFTFSLG